MTDTVIYIYMPHFVTKYLGIYYINYADISTLTQIHPVLCPCVTFEDMELIGLNVEH